MITGTRERVSTAREPARRFTASSRGMVYGAAGLAIVAAVLPSGWLVSALAGAPPDPALVAGGRLFKIFLAANALALLALGLGRRPGPAVPLTAGPGHGEDRGGPRLWWAVVGLALVALVLRLPGLGHGLWYDEIETLVRYAQLPFGRIVTTFDSQNQHALYSVLAHIPVALLGAGAWAVRLPAVVLGAAGIAALYYFGEAVTDRREALAAAAVLTVSYHDVWFSQNARGYTGLLLGTLVGSRLLLDLLRAREHRGWGTAFLYAGVMSLTIYVHSTAALVVAAHGLIWLWLLLRRRGEGARTGLALWGPLVAFVFCGLFALQLYALVLPQYVRTLAAPTMGGTDTAWKSPVWFVSEALRGLQRGLPGGWLTLFAGLVVVIAGLASYLRRSATVAALMLLPVIVTAVALLATGHNLWPRFFFFAAGFGVLIAVRGVFALSSLLPQRHARTAAWLVVALAVLGNVALLPRAWRPKQDYEGALRYVAAHRLPGESVVTVDMTRLPYRALYHAGWTSVESVEALRSLEAADTGTWVVYTFPIRLAAVHPAIWERLRTEYAERADFRGTVGGGDIIVMYRQ